MDISVSERSDLKENILASKLEGLTEWIIGNRPKVLTGLGVFLAVVLVSSVLILRRQEQTDLTWTRLSQAQAYLSQKHYPEAEQLLQDLKVNAPTSETRLMANYFYGDLMLELKKYDEAVRTYSDVISRSGSSPLKPLALSALGFAYEEKKDFAQAGTTYQQFLDQYADHFMAARTQLSAGRVQLLAGNKEGAKKSLGQLIDLYPASEWAKAAREILTKI